MSSNSDGSCVEVGASRRRKAKDVLFLVIRTLAQVGGVPQLPESDWLALKSICFCWIEPVLTSVWYRHCQWKTHWIEGGWSKGQIFREEIYFGLFPRWIIRDCRDAHSWAQSEDVRNVWYERGEPGVTSDDAHARARWEERRRCIILLYHEDCAHYIEWDVLTIRYDSIRWVLRSVWKRSMCARLNILKSW